MSTLPFDVVVTRHGPAVLRVCRSVLTPPDADDAWSETFLSALRAYPDLPGGANVEAWLVRIARRKALDVLRAAGRRPAAVAEVPDGPSALGVWQPPEDELWDRLRALPPKQRQAVAYHHVAGLPHAEVALLLGGTAAAARRAAADGIAALRRATPGAPAPQGRSSSPDRTDPQERP
ncbi:RNA polymerase sigma factor [Microlunatus capsulatus]|uniref:RNA polymerase sigma factor (Sigma-70 family) n=1 Tax=Microlunatus capsulatus TaxID=99117 RepID=A0ABS4Z6M7_9ACTN|nr:sigma-70 family RNA polymerase sigma factor [Microlunatus capsulatus]MBP2416703.1 RNA polymerase sigma factor (sigma-70 family) [Microlunatus capsulatus]